MYGYQWGEFVFWNWGLNDKPFEFFDRHFSAGYVPLCIRCFLRDGGVATPRQIVDFCMLFTLWMKERIGPETNRVRFGQVTVCDLPLVLAINCKIQRFLIRSKLRLLWYVSFRYISPSGVPRQSYGHWFVRGVPVVLEEILGVLHVLIGLPRLIFTGRAALRVLRLIE